MKRQYNHIYGSAIKFEYIFATWNVVARTCRNKKFYEIYFDDIITLGYLLDNNRNVNSIRFGIMKFRKVIDWLVANKLGYVIVSNGEIVV